MVSSAALTAKAIRLVLKTAFPKQKFSVKSETFAGGNSVHVKYTDYVPEQFVYDIVRHFKYGSFDGMYDLYEFTNCRDDIPQAKYVSVDRDISLEFARAILDLIKSKNYTFFPDNAELIDEGTWWTVKSPDCPHGQMNIGGYYASLNQSVRNYSTYFAFIDGELKPFPDSKPSITSQMNNGCECFTSMLVSKIAGGFNER